MSFIVLRGKRVDKEILVDFKDENIEKSNNFMNKMSDTSNIRKKQPDWHVPGSRASKLVEKSLKNHSTNETLPKEKENRPRFVSPTRKLLRQDDDLSLKPSNSSKLSR